MAAKKQTQPKTASDKKVTLARQENGSIQITFSIPWVVIEKNRTKKAKEMAEDITVPGFRKGKAPIEKATARIPQEQLIERTLSDILPQLYAKALEEQKITPAMYPKFELVSAKENEDWQVRAVTCELPDVDLGDYKKVIKDSKASEASEIWTPEKGDPKEKKELSLEEKQNSVIRSLIEHYKFEVPEMIVDSEVDSRLASLLERLEKLGLSLESYLASVKKTAPELRSEYQVQAEGAIRLDIVLGQIAQKEKISVSHDEIHEFLQVSDTASGKKHEHDPEQESTIRVFLTKRKVLDSLASVLS